jgi:hypothetical protein
MEAGFGALGGHSAALAAGLSGSGPAGASPVGFAQLGEVAGLGGSEGAWHLQTDLRDCSRSIVTMTIRARLGLISPYKDAGGFVRLAVPTIASRKDRVGIRCLDKVDRGTIVVHFLRRLSVGVLDFHLFSPAAGSGTWRYLTAHPSAFALSSAAVYALARKPKGYTRLVQITREPHLRIPSQPNDWPTVRTEIVTCLLVFFIFFSCRW